MCLENRSTIYFFPSGFIDMVLICSTWNPSSRYIQDFSHLTYRCPSRIWYLFPSSSLCSYCFVSCFSYVGCFYFCLFVLGIDSRTLCTTGKFSTTGSTSSCFLTFHTSLSLTFSQFWLH